MGIETVISRARAAKKPDFIVLNCTKSTRIHPMCGTRLAPWSPILLN